MRRDNLPADIEIREFWHDPKDYLSWIDARKRYRPEIGNFSVWGSFANLAASGRFTFSRVDQAQRHFGETLVAWHIEQQGYVCWTYVWLFRNPGRALGKRAPNTQLINCILRETVGLVPQAEYENRYRLGFKVKTIDVVGFHFGKIRWAFSEVKRRDRLHADQLAGLRFLKELIPEADVFIGLVQERSPELKTLEPANTALQSTGITGLLSAGG